MTTTRQPTGPGAATGHMKATVVQSFTEPLPIEERPIPVPGRGQVLVRIEASGLCHTDIHAAHGDWPAKPTPPVIPGHEGVGIVAATGPGVDDLAVGTRVAIPWLGYACGACEYCGSGWETLCPSQRNTGYSMDGGFAEYALGFASNVGRVPDGIDPFDAAPLTCAGVTTSTAITVSGARTAWTWRPREIAPSAFTAKVGELRSTSGTSAGSGG